MKNKTLTCCTVLQTDVVWTRRYKIYWEIVLLNHYGETLKKVGQYKSRVLFEELDFVLQLEKICF